MQTDDLEDDIHWQFARYFKDDTLSPYLYHLSKKLEEGGICLSLHEDVENVEGVGALKALPKVLLNSSLVSAGERISALVLDNDNLYFQRYYKYETQILGRILAMSQLRGDAEEIKEKLIAKKDFIKSLFNFEKKTGGAEDINWQFVAAITAVLRNFCIITGGPGTGKTITVSAILSILYTIYPTLRVALAAPTGKAAARMAESLKQSATARKLPEDLQQKFATLKPETIHRLLGTKRYSTDFKHNAASPLQYDVVICDESSMLDVSLFAHLIEAVGAGTKLIMLGDMHQLAAVEAGSVFGDLCKSQTEANAFSSDTAQFFLSISGHKYTFKNGDIKHPLFEHLVSLQKSYRFSDDKGIGKFSRAILDNNKTLVEKFFTDADPEVVIDETQDDALLYKFCEGYEQFIKEKKIDAALILFNKLRVLCAVRQGSRGLFEINRKIEQHLHSKGLIFYRDGFYENRPLLITANDYNLGLYNGDIGICRKDEEGRMRVYFEQAGGKIISFFATALHAYETVFALTIHKSQGSEFDEVLIVLPEESKILTRELLYTGITRAKKKVIVCASRDVIFSAIETPVNRSSGLEARLQKKKHSQPIKN